MNLCHIRVEYNIVYFFYLINLYLTPRESSSAHISHFKDFKSYTNREYDLMQYFRQHNIF